MPLTVASLFAGLGGFDVAAEELGYQVVLQAENNPAARAILRARFPQVQLHDDATTVDLRGIDIVTAGFPCQGLSNAATSRKHGGLFDPESMSYVIWQVLDRIAEAKPGYVLLENADSLGSTRYADDLSFLLSMMRAHGYEPNVIRLNAGMYGSNMRRIRTFILCRRKYWLVPVVESELSYRCSAEAIGVNNQQGGAALSASSACRWGGRNRPDQRRSGTSALATPSASMPPVPRLRYSCVAAREPVPRPVLTSTFTSTRGRRAGAPLGAPSVGSCETSKTIGAASTATNSRTACPSTWRGCSSMPTRR